jgi:hypothetical protein
VSFTLAGALPATGIRGAGAQAIRDVLAHPGPLIASNLVWGVVAFVGWLGATIATPLGIVFALVLVWPTATVATIAGRVVRGEEPVLRDAFRWPFARPAVGVLGGLAVVCALVGVVDLQGALERGDLAGIAFATFVGWGLVALGVLACVVWPLVGDPVRADRSTRDLVRLGVTIALARTPRIVGAWLVVGTLLVVSAVLAAAIVSVSVSVAALILARVVLPIADALDRQPE